MADCEGTLVPSQASPHLIHQGPALELSVVTAPEVRDSGAWMRGRSN